MAHTPAHDSEASIARVLKYTGLFGGVQGLYVLISIIRGKFTAILLGAGGVGLIDMYTRTAELIGQSTNLGLSTSAVPRVARLAEHGSPASFAHYARLVRSWVLITAIAGFVVTIALAPFWAYLALGSARHTTMFMALSPLVAILTLTGGEMAILKGKRQLKTIALITVIGAVSTLAITVPTYWAFGTMGIVPALVASSGVVLLMDLAAAHRIVPYRVTLTDCKFLRRGLGMVRLGVSFIATGIVCTTSELLVRAFIVHSSGMDDAGIYAAGFTLTVTYMRLIFTSMDADYYPRLSSAAGQPERQNVTVCRQIDVLTLLMAPMLLAFCIGLPLVVRLLYSAAFYEAIPLVYAAALYMYFRSIATPIGYLALAHRRSSLYLLVESVYAVAFLLTATAGYALWGVVGAGFGLTLSYIIYGGAAWAVYGRAFSFRMDGATLRRTAVQLVILAAGLAVCAQRSAANLNHLGIFSTPTDTLLTLIACALLIISSAYTVNVFRHHLTLPERLSRWLGRLLGRPKEDK